MKYNIALIGYGKWGKILAKEIKNNKYFNLIGVVSSQNIENDLKINSYKDFKSLIKIERLDCVYIAKDAETNLKMLDYCKTLKLPLIFEKPISTNSKNCKKMINIIKDNKLIAFTNLPNIFSDTFIPTKKFIQSNETKIKKIIIHEGNCVPKRNNLNPILDWGIHPLTYIFNQFEESKIEKIKYRKIINSNLDNRIVVRIDILLNNKLNIKVLTGNLFKKKSRILKIVLNNGDVFTNNFVKHQIKLNNIIIYKSRNKPLDNLLIKFVKSINNNENLEGLKSIYKSYDSLKILEKLL